MFGPRKDLSNLQLVTAPKEVLNLTYLISLDLSGNLLQYLPLSYGQLTAFLVVHSNLFACTCELVTIFQTAKMVDTPFTPHCVSEGQLKKYWISNLLKNEHATMLCDNSAKSHTGWLSNRLDVTNFQTGLCFISSLAGSCF